MQSGTGVRALAGYLNQYQFLPLKRVREGFGDLFDQPLADGILFETDQTGAEGDGCDWHSDPLARAMHDERILNSATTG